MRIKKIWTALAALGLGTVMFSPALTAGECIEVVNHEFFGEKQTMDPHLVGGTDDSAHLEAIYEGLVTLDNNYGAVPALATSWESNSDGSEWTFHLRKGVKWHDGKDFTAEDVVYSFQRLVDPTLGSGAIGTLAPFYDPDGVVAVDQHTVLFKLKSPVVTFPVAHRTKFSSIVQKGSTSEQLKLNGVGTGAFVQEVFTPGGSERIMRRNANYWEDGLPKSDCIRITSITEPVARMTSILNGESDLHLAVDAATIAVLQGNPAASLIKTPGAMPQGISMYIDTPPFDNPKVRMALKLLVDRERMLNVIALGLGEVGNDAPVVPSSPWAFSSQAREFDLEKAKKLLAEAGYDSNNPLKLDLYTAEAYPGMVNFAQLYAQMAAEAGIKMNVIRTPDETFWTDTWMNYPLITTSWGARPPVEALAVAYRKASPWNETHWFRDDFDELLDKANAAIDVEDQKKYLQQAQKMLHDEGGIVIAYFSSVVSALRTGCEGYQPNVQVSLVDYRNVTCK